MFKCEVGDHVYVDWKNTGEWFYGDIMSISLIEGERLYDILYGDGDLEYGVGRDRVQFLDRPPMTKELQDKIDSFVSRIRVSKQDIFGGDESVSVVGSVIDLTRSTTNIDDPEKGELTGHTETC